MKETVLVTGAAGFVGSHVVRHLLHYSDHDVVGLVSFRHHGCPLRIDDITNRRFRVVYHDLRGPISGRLANEIGPVDHILNIAAESHVERSIQEPASFIRNNVDVAINALEFARAIQPRTFVQISTDEVYGPAPGAYCHREWDPIKPSNPYSASKAAQEAIAFSYWRTYGVPVIITNTMNNFGERQDPEKFIPYVVYNIKWGRKFGIHGDGEVFSRRFWTYVRNHADALLFLIQRPVPMYPEAAEPLRVNIVGEVELDSRQMVKEIADVMGMPADWYAMDYHSTRPGHDLRYALDGSKLENMGWKPPYEFYDRLARVVEWYAKAPAWQLEARSETHG